MSLSIVHYPHPTLRYRSKTVQRVDKDLKEIVARMFDLMYEHSGVGLAANQIDLPLRIFVANPTGKRGEGEELVCINPELNFPKGSESDREGCLSLPGIYGDVKRPAQIQLSAYDLAGNPIERKLDGFFARVVQHEKDHLDGVFFFDRMSDDHRGELINELEELESAYRAGQASGVIPADEEIVKRRAQWETRYA
jgi:peptide deformylase